MRHPHHGQDLVRKQVVILMMTALLIPGSQAKAWDGDNPTPIQIDRAVDAWMEAERQNNQMQLTEPPPPPEILGVLGLPIAPMWLDNCDEMRFYRQQAGLPSSFDSIGWRESNCRNEDGVRTSCCHGYWQLHRIHFNGSGYIYGKWCDARSYWDVNSDNPDDKQRQACAAKALYDKEGTSPWSATR